MKRLMLAALSAALFFFSACFAFAQDLTGKVQMCVNASIAIKDDGDEERGMGVNSEDFVCADPFQSGLHARWHVNFGKLLFLSIGLFKPSRPA